MLFTMGCSALAHRARGGLVDGCRDGLIYIFSMILVTGGEGGVYAYEASS